MKKILLVLFSIFILSCNNSTTSESSQDYTELTIPYNYSSLHGVCYPSSSTSIYDGTLGSPVDNGKVDKINTIKIIIDEITSNGIKVEESAEIDLYIKLNSEELYITKNLSIEAGQKTTFFESIYFSFEDLNGLDLQKDISIILVNHSAEYSIKLESLVINTAILSE